MSNWSHTKGPWKVVKEDGRVHVGTPDSSFSNGWKILASCCPLNISGPGEQIPNAYLIAAAPEMLEALEIAVRFFIENGGEQSYSFLPQLKKAVIKAKGAE